MGKGSVAKTGSNHKKSDADFKVCLRVFYIEENGVLKLRKKWLRNDKKEVK